MAEIAVVIGGWGFAACGGGSMDPAGAGGTGGGGNASGQLPAPVVPAPGHFVWTAGGVTIAASDAVSLNGLKAVGYRVSNGTLIIEAQTEQSQFCSLTTPAPSLPAPGTYPVVGDGIGRFQVLCTDPTSAVGSSMYVTGGAVVLTKAETDDVEGTFTISGVPEAASGGFNVRCIYADCAGPQRP